MQLYRIQIKASLTREELIARARGVVGFVGSRSGALWLAREVKFRRALGHDPRELAALERHAANAVELSFSVPGTGDGSQQVLFAPGRPLDIAHDEDAPIEPALRALATALDGTLVPNPWLGPPSSLRTLPTSTTVTSPTPLSELLRPHLGICLWAACRVERWGGDRRDGSL